jgi:hypothetical protein
MHFQIKNCFQITVPIGFPLTDIFTYGIPLPFSSIHFPFIWEEGETKNKQAINNSIEYVSFSIVSIMTN